MKVFHIDSEKTFRGGQRQVLYLLEGLKERGVENFLFCPGKYPLFERAGYISKIPAAMLGEFDIFSAFKISRHINREEPDIIHCHSAHALSIGLIAKKLASFKPALIAARRVDFHIRCLRKYLSADRIITVSKAIQKILISDGVPADKIDVVYSGIKNGRQFENLKGDYLYKELGLNKNDIIVGNIAALTEQKDHFTLLKAAKIALDKNKNMKFIIVGDGGLRRKLMDFSCNNGTGDNVIFTGFRKDAFNFLNIFDVFVMSSKWEGLGTSILDAMSSGVPVVSTSAGGIKEIIEDGENGLLADPGDDAALAGKIIKLASDSALRKTFADKGRKTAEKFSSEKTAEGTLAVYRKVVNGN
ncbi:MAG: glycosyl transferase [Elusimicrobia bacterium HGW-Elusimicrobia-2]|nr:MAG: glycosyl transferase [Elusimicrobia bacterium HGW-Elusimicrobia-2]